MLKSLDVKKDIKWVGSLDHDIRVFDVIMYTEFGTTYNSFVLKSNEKTVLFEVSKDKFYDQFISRLQDATQLEDIDYIVVNHTEPDHTGALSRLLESCPKAQVVGTGAAIRFLKEILNKDFKSITVKDGDTISLGDKTLQFLVVPMLHWPDSMYTYVPESKALFTCDSFGCHYCDEKVFNDLIEGDFFDAYKYYYDCIFGPYKSSVLFALDRIKGLDIETICCGHGPVLRKDIDKYIELYRTWSTPIKNEVPKAVIAYVSAYGYTKKLAETIAEGICSAGKIEVSLFDMVECKKEDVLAEIGKADCVLFGSPTMIGDALPPIWELLSNLNPTIHRNKLAGAFGSYGWSGEAVPNLDARIKQLRMKTPFESLKVMFNPSEEQLKEAFLFGKKFGEELGMF